MENGSHGKVVEAIKELDCGDWSKNQCIGMFRYLLEVGNLLGAKNSTTGWGEDITIELVEQMVRCGWDKETAMKCRNSGAVTSWRRSGPRLNVVVNGVEITKDELVKKLLKGGIGL